MGSNMKPEIIQRMAARLRRTLRFLQGWIVAPPVPKAAQGMGGVQAPDPKYIPPAGMSGSM